MEHLEVSPVGHDPAARQSKDATTGASAELGEVVAQQFRQLGMNRDRAGFFLGPVLEFPALADAAVIGPVGAATRLRIGEQELTPCNRFDLNQRELWR